MRVIGNFIMLFLFMASITFTIKASERLNDKNMRLACTGIGILLMLIMCTLIKIGFI